jgi:DUF4097 and DUF4098 domain-containing protein YvlB
MDNRLKQRATPLCLALLSGACSFSSDREGFKLEIGPGAIGLSAHTSQTSRIESPLELVSGDELVIGALQGDLLLRTSSEEAPKLVGVLTAEGPPDSDVGAVLGAARIRMRRNGRALEVDVGRDDALAALVSLRSDLDLCVPPGVAVRVESTAGEIHLTGPLQGVEAHTQYGAITIESVQGDCRAHTNSGSIALVSVGGGSGRVSAETNYGDVALRAVRAQSVEALSSSGDLSLTDVVSPVITARSSFGSIVLGSIEGDVSAETSSGRVEVRGALRGKHRLHSGYGDVAVERAQGTLEASSNSGAVQVRDCAGTVLARSGFGDVEIEGVLFGVTAESNSGAVSVKARSGSAPESDWQISSRFGDLLLHLPWEFPCSLDARTDFGAVDADFPLERRSDGAAGGAWGDVGGGGKRIELHTSSGAIELRRAPEAATGR